jgi:hypothetical protein
VRDTPLLVSGGSAQPERKAPSSSALESAATPGRQTLSELVAKILDQLSVSAWLPAGILVFAALAVGTLRATHGRIGDAFGKLGHLSLASLLLVLGAVVLTTVLTQAFQFEAIQLLEGYWGPGRVRAAIADAMCRRHLAKRNALRGRLRDLEDRAFAGAMMRMLEGRIDPAVVDLVAKVRRGEVDPDQLSDAQRLQVENHRWEDFAPLGLLRRMDDVGAAQRCYPEEDRAIRATRLGNTLRSYEDPVEEQIERSIGRFVQDVFHRLPGSLRTDHDQLRGRLDLYCSLVIVFGVVGLTGVGLLAGIDWVEAAIFAGMGGLLAWLSYRAALTSARAYGSLLETLADWHADVRDRHTAGG